MIDLDRLEQSQEERDIRDDEVMRVIDWIQRNVDNGNGAKWFIISNLKRSAHRGYAL